MSWLRHDLEERCAGAVEIHACDPAEALVQRLAGILLQVRAGNGDALGAAVIEHNVESALRHDRQLVLADLIALRQVRIEVVLAREHRLAGYARADREAEAHGHANRLAIQHRQHAGEAEIDEARLGVGRRTVGRRGAGEDLRPGSELRVDLEPDDGFPRTLFGAHANRSGDCRCQSVSSW